MDPSPAIVVTPTETTGTGFPDPARALPGCGDLGRDEGSTSHPEYDGVGVEESVELHPPGGRDSAPGRFASDKHIPAGGITVEETVHKRELHVGEQPGRHPRGLGAVAGCDAWRLFPGASYLRQPRDDQMSCDAVYF